MADGFNPDQFLAQTAPSKGFDPDSFLSDTSGSKGNPAMAKLEGYGQGLSGGYLPQLQAAAEKGVLPVPLLMVQHALQSDPSHGSDADLRAQGFHLPEESSYVEVRDQNIARQKQEAQQNPGSYYGGQAAGILTTAPILSSALSEIPALAAADEYRVVPGAINNFGPKAIQMEPIAQGFLRGAANAGTGGALVGALQNPGDTEGRVDPLQTALRLKGAATGAATGVAAHGLGTALEKGAGFLSNAPQAVKDWAETAPLENAKHGLGKLAKGGALLGAYEGGKEGFREEGLPGAVKGALKGGALGLGAGLLLKSARPALSTLATGADYAVSRPASAIEELLQAALKNPAAAGAVAAQIRNGGSP